MKQNIKRLSGVISNIELGTDEVDQIGDKS